MPGSKPAAPAALFALAAATVAVILLVFAGAFAAPPASADAPPADAPPADAPVLNVGHRGASGYAPEHTIPAYDLALRQGADYIEQDLQLTKDGVLVVLHDSTLDRTARGPAENCTGLVGTKTLAQIKTCDVGGWFNEEYPRYARPGYVGLKIPTLEQVFRRYGRGVNYYIETKSPEQAPGMEEELLRLMDEYGLREPATQRWRVLIQSFSPTSLKKIHASDPSLPLIQLYEDTTRTSETVSTTLDAARGYAVGIGPSEGDVDASLVAAAHERCLDVHSYTVDETAQMRVLVGLGVDGMFTNFPNRLERVLGADAAGGGAAARRAAEASAACRRPRP